MEYRQITKEQAEFPDRLRRIERFEMPASLWTRGDESLDLLKGPTLAIVGARACSSYGRSVAREFGRVASAAGVVVISGLARGIDGEAHRGAVNVVGGKTVAVLGCGIDTTYPAAHAELAHAIVADGGLILSEYEPRVAPAPWRFPARNRIVAGLADVIVCIEARERSGSLITCDFGIEMGKVVMAVPGQITSELGKGSNMLIKEGARIATCVEDVLKAIEEVRA